MSQNYRRLIKMCTNESCIDENKKMSVTNLDKICSKCGQPLYHVCANKHCYNLLDKNTDKYCNNCIARRARKHAYKQERIDKSLDYLKENINLKDVTKVVGAITPIAITVAKKSPELVKQGAKLFKK